MLSSSDNFERRAHVAQDKIRANNAERNILSDVISTVDNLKVRVHLTVPRAMHDIQSSPAVPPPLPLHTPDAVLPCHPRFSLCRTTSFQGWSEA
jgi:hypothetical protein